jgi:hypothetical protein
VFGNRRSNACPLRLGRRLSGSCSCWAAGRHAVPEGAQPTQGGCGRGNAEVEYGWTSESESDLAWRAEPGAGASERDGVEEVEEAIHVELLPRPGPCPPPSPAARPLPAGPEASLPSHPPAVARALRRAAVRCRSGRGGAEVPR